MNKLSYGLTALAFILMTLILPPAFARADSVIYYDVQDNDEHFRLANMLYNLVAHFDTTITARDIQGYTSGDMSAFDFTYYIGSVCGSELPESFLGDIADGTHRVMWIGCNLDRLTDYIGGSSAFGFEYESHSDGVGRNRIDYKGRHLERDQGLEFFQVRVTGSPTVSSYISPDGAPDESAPHFLCGGDLCYLAEIPFYYNGIDERMNALADLLHIFTQSDVPEQKLAMLRFEDLAPYNNDPAKLRDVADELISRGIPFSFGVIPVFRDPSGEYYPEIEAHFQDDPDFVDVINYFLENGEIMIEHGYTHQHDPELTGRSWEFAVDAYEHPLPCDSEEWARGRIEAGLAEFEAMGWKPFIWETPHYSASHGDYAVFADYFGYCYERPRVFNVPPDSPPIFLEFLNPEGQTIPYFTETSTRGLGVIPETIGYIDVNEDNCHPEDLLEKADKISIIRDGVASFYYHHTMVEKNDLFKVVDGLLDRGYTFVGIDHFVTTTPTTAGTTTTQPSDKDDSDDGMACGC